MPAKTTKAEETTDPFITTPATSAQDQLAKIDAQFATLTAQKKAARASEQTRRAEAKAAKDAAKIQTLEEVIATQEKAQKLVIQTIAGRVLKRVAAGQDQGDAMRAVLEQLESWALEEIQRRQTSK